MRKLIIIAITVSVFFIITGCSNNGSSSDGPAKIESNPSATPEQVVEKYCQAWEEKDVDAIIALIHPKMRNGVRGMRLVNSVEKQLNEIFETRKEDGCKAGEVEKSEIDAKLKQEFMDKHSLVVEKIASATYLIKTDSNPDAWVESETALISAGGEWYMLF